MEQGTVCGAPGRAGWGRWLWAALILVLLGCGACRLLGDALQRPMLGYADNYDMIRLMAAYSVWPVDGIRGMNHPQAPWRRFGFADFGSGCAIYSSQILLQAPAVGTMWLIDRFRPGTVFDMRAIGFSQALLILLLGAAYCRRFYTLGHRGAALMNGLVVALLAGDPINTLYLNGFYCDLSAVFFLYWALLAGILVLLAGPTPGRLVLVGLSLFLLAATRLQHSPTALLLGAALLTAAWIAGRRLPRGLAIAVCLGTSAGVAFGVWTMRRPDLPTQEIRKCYLTDSILGGILPLAKDRARAVALLGMPPRCVEYVGMNWYHPRIDQGRACPELFQVSRISLLRLFWDDPTLAWRIYKKGLVELENQPRGLLVELLGLVEGASHASAPRWSLADPVAALHGSARRAFWLLPLALAAFYTLWTALRLWSNRPPYVGLLVMICTLLAYAIMFLTVLGDGYADYLRHNHATVNLLLAVYLLAGGHFLASVVRAGEKMLGAFRATSNPPASPPPDAAGTPPVPACAAGRWCSATIAAALFLALTAGMVVYLREPFRDVALDSSKLDRPVENCGWLESAQRMPNGTVQVFGWACDPRRKVPAERIILVQAGRVLPVHVFHGSPRPEIASSLGLPSTGLGWVAAIPKRFIGRGGPVEAFAVFADGVLGRLPAARGVKIIGDG